MAKAGVLTIDVDAGTAKFIVEMEKAGATVGKFGQSAQQSGQHVVTSMQASSAAIRLLENPLGNNIRAVERFIGLMPGVGKALQAAFPIIGLIAFGDIFVKMGREVFDFFQKMEQAPAKMANAFNGISQPLKLTNDELQLSNDRLANEIAKLEGKPQNGLALALDQARVMADKLADSLDKDLERLQKVMSENKPGFFAGLLKPGTGAADSRAEQLRLQLARDSGSPAIQMQDLQTELRNVQADLVRMLAVNAPHGMSGINDGSTKGGGATEEIARLKQYAATYQAEIDRIAGEEKNAELTKQKNVAEAAKANNDKRTREAEEAARKQEEIYQLSRRAWAEAQRDIEDTQNDLNRAAERLYETNRRVAESNAALAKSMTRTGANKFYDEQAKSEDETLKKTALDERLRGTPIGALLAITGPTTQKQQAGISEDQRQLQLLQQMNEPLALQRDIREKILEAQIEMGIETGKDVSAQQAQLANLKAQQQLSQWRAGAGGIYGDALQTAMRVPQALGGALASGIMDHRKGEDIGAQIRKALEGLGQQLLGQSFTKLIGFLAAQTLATTANTAATTTNASVTGVHAGIMTTHLGIMVTHTGVMLAHLATMIGNTVATLANTIATIAAAIAGFFHAATGGKFSAGDPIIVGEKGRELFVPDEPGTIIPNNMLSNTDSGYSRVAVPAGGSRSSSNITGGNHTINIYESADARQTARHITDFLKSSGPGFAPASSN